MRSTTDITSCFGTIKKPIPPPGVFVESLSLSVYTTTNCANSADKLEPRVIPGTGKTVFTSEAAGCFYLINTPDDWSAVGMPEDDTFCFHNPNDATRLFASYAPIG